jgi:hypothetical protein
METCVASGVSWLLLLQATAKKVVTSTVELGENARRKRSESLIGCSAYTTIWLQLIGGHFVIVVKKFSEEGMPHAVLK